MNRIPSTFFCTFFYSVLFFIYLVLASSLLYQCPYFSLFFTHFSPVTETNDTPKIKDSVRKLFLHSDFSSYSVLGILPSTMTDTRQIFHQYLQPEFHLDLSPHKPVTLYFFWRQFALSFHCFELVEDRAYPRNVTIYYAR